MKPAVREQTEFDSKLAALKPPAALPPDAANLALVITDREVNACLSKHQPGENVQMRLIEGNVSAAIIIEGRRVW